MLPVKLVDVVKTFTLPAETQEQTVIDGVSLEITASDSVAFMGPSGSGKSTLLNLIAGLEQPSSGQIFLGKDELSGLAARERERLRLQSLSYVFQFFHLLPTLTTLENCALVAIEQGQRGIDEIIDETHTTLKLLGLEGAAHKRPGQLSGGMQARAALARALVSRPKIILADEPTGNLDSKSGEAVLDLLFEQQRERRFTLLLVTHDESAARRAQRTVRLRDGRLLS
ncbi:MAG: ABC transporter ATP-binding protein [Betaproteobacteria bacterium]|nr:ABC transporter ATP-binding protein [Betaproteobacteria bacterium]